MGTKRIKQSLMLLLVVGAIIAVAAGSGTFASFNAQVTNPDNTFAAGTLFLHQTADGTTCASESGTLNVNPGTVAGGDECDILFDGVDLTAGGAQTAELALANAGTIPASNIKFSVSSCSVTTNSTATGSSTTFGTAPTCSDFLVTIQEKDDNTFATDLFCAFGPGSLTTTCNAPASSVNLGNSSSFANLKTTGNVDATLDEDGGTTDTRFYTVTVEPSVGSGNQLQNRLLTFSMSWQINS
jgi:predicted ribosomally synthesized peptide with SipW-like signal peptide